jgi:transposase InsO family protein
MDLFSRKIVGWAMRDHPRTELASSALTMALQRQRPGAERCRASTGAQSWQANAGV